MGLVRGLGVAVPRADHHPLDPQLRHLIKEPPDLARVRAIEKSRIGRHPEPASHRFADRFGRDAALFGRVLNALLKGSSTLGIEPARCVFVDDREKNVAAAREVGMRGIVFEDAAQLRRELDLTAG